ncbi:MAG: HPr family phosphocarrier protein [Desulfurococcaceae archaeon]|nr:HPr family phosphocarrier protein [Desulfurococcaceae archaeon]
MVTILSIKLKNRSGLHARPASVFVRKCKAFKSIIKVQKGDKVADAKNILQVLSLGADCGDEILIEINGEDEKIAAEEIKKLVEEELPEIDK